MRLTRVGLGALFFDPGVSGGSETYLQGLVPALVEARPDVRFELVTTRRGAAALTGAPGWEDVELVRLACDDDEPVRRTAAERVVLPRLARQHRWDVLHSLSNRGPRRAGAAHVLTVLDVIFFHHRTMGRLSTLGMRWVVASAARNADALISISEAAAADVAATLGIDRDRVAAIPLGPGRAPIEPAPLHEVRARYRLEDARTVLCVAAKRPHKNQRLLIEGLPLLPSDVLLVLVGHDEGYGAELDAAARAAGVRERLRLLDDVADVELEALWRVAACAAFPTRAEGFGLPVLEAMRRGVPVACSDIPVLREVGGDAARYFDVDSPADAAAAIDGLLSDRSSGERGPERAAGFSWERTAEATLEVYERALRRRG